VKLAALLVVGVFVAAGSAYVTRAPASLSGCTYESTLMDRGTRLASSAGSAIHSLNGPVPTAQISDTVRGTWRTLGFWVGVFGAAVQGRPTVTSVPVACGACPTAAGTTPPVATPSVPHRSGLTGAALAADAARRASFPESQISMAATVAKYESTWIPTRVNNWKPNAHMMGMWQIYREVHPALMKLGDWRDPYVNARMAYQVWLHAPHGGRNWSPWSTAATARRHLVHVPPASGRPVRAASFARPMPVASVQSQAPCPSPTAPPPPKDSQPGASTPPGWDFAGNRTVDQAVTYMETMAARRTRIPSGMCLHYVAVAYGHNGTAMVHGRHWAIDVFDSMPSQFKHPGMSAPPRGALVFWRTGGPGHIALSLGGGRIASTDFDGTRYRAGIIGIGPISALDRWGKRAGYAAPWFVGQTRVGANA
jgi:hypothetical protein